MSRPLPEYAADFPVEAEAEFAGYIEEAANAIYIEMQGGALDVALDAMQAILTSFRAGDRTLSAADAMRAAREIRALMHEKAALLRMSRAQAIERLGLRPRPPVDGTGARLAASKTAPATAEPAPAEGAEKIVKTARSFAPRTPAADKPGVPAEQSETSIAPPPVAVA
ncbi:MAG: hypothetical protein HS108_01645 [Planctomycetes bacterium]|nr:hypothetical protein [Planctomycetota bacterium]MCL4731932.1 hypothetical protein [Planctomycetota bacterium]